MKCITLEEELEKNTELKMSNIQILREWCEKQPHLPHIQDVQFAILLHSNYHNLEPTKSTIENYYSMRTHTPEIFSNRDPLSKEIQDISKVIEALFLKKKTKEGYTIIFGRLLDNESSHFFLNDFFKYGFMLLDHHIWTNGSLPGYIYMADAKGVSFGHIARLNPVLLKKFVFYVQEALPFRLKGVYIFNTSPVVEMIYNMMKPFLKAELAQLIHFYTKVEDGSKHYPLDALPTEIGQTCANELKEEQLKDMINFREWYLEDEKINRVNESLRMGKSKTASDLFGVEGSFKKLDID